MKLFLAYATLSILAASASAGALISVTALTGQPQPNVMVGDSTGNLYLGSGVVFPTAGLSPGPTAAVTKLSRDGNLVFATKLAPNPESAVTALALAPDGSIWAAGLVQGGFPVTKDAVETQPQGDPTGFVARLDTSGRVTYASYLNGIAAAPSGLGSPLAMATDDSGAVYITGQGIFNSTPGALAPVTSTGFSYFTVKLDQNGKQVWATGGIGGSVIAVDAFGYVYIGGSAVGGFALPITPGVLQPSSASNACGNAGLTGFLCFNQYAAKLDPAGSKLIYCTWLSGSYGASPSSLVIDGQGNAILAGTTQSSDYPTTPDGFQTVEFAVQPIFPSQTVHFSSDGPAYTGYVTKLNAAGTGLIFSTYLGGSAEDTVDEASIDAQDNIYLVGLATSPDFPGVSGVPDGCRASDVHQVPYLTRLSADGSSLTVTQLAYGVVDAQGFPVGGGTPQTALAVVDGEGGATVAFNGSLASLSLFAPAQRFVCATDAGDHAPVTQIAPGELLELLGNNIGEPEPMTLQPAKGVIPVAFGDGSAVKIHGVPAPILYSSVDQINIQVPYEIAGQTKVTLEIDDPSGKVAGTQEFAVVSSQPRAFTSVAEYAACNGNHTASFLAVALNADGSLNSCSNPAEAGSTITMFVNSPGTRGVTGAIAASPPTPLALPVTVSGEAQFMSAESAPGSINSVWRVKLSLTPNSNGVTNQPAEFMLTIGGVPVQDPLTVWVKSTQ